MGEDVAVTNVFLGNLLVWLPAACCGPAAACACTPAASWPPPLLLQQASPPSSLSMSGPIHPLQTQVLPTTIAWLEFMDAVGLFDAPTPAMAAAKIPCT